MKKTIVSIFIAIVLFSCSSRHVEFIDHAYLGMPADEFHRKFQNTYLLKSSDGAIVCTLQPGIINDQLDSLTLCVNDIGDHLVAHTVYELANDFRLKYGAPVKIKETVWAGGSSKFIKWQKGGIEIIYSYTYNQNPGTHGILYTGEASLSYKAVTNHAEMNL